MLEPSLPLLCAKTVYFLLATGACGWALYPQAIYPRSRIGSWVAWQTLGISVLLLSGFTLLRMHLPARPLWVVPWLLPLIRLAILGLRYRRDGRGPIAWVRGLEDPAPLRRSFLAYVAVTGAICALYLLPFIVRGTSGLYAYGGGDHSTYFGFSAELVDQSVDDVSSGWDIDWDTLREDEDARRIFKRNLKRNAPMLVPPSTNWSFRQYVRMVQTDEATTYASQTVSIPFIALVPGSSEESYSAGMATYVALLCWAAALLVTSFFRERPPPWVIAVGALAVAVGSPAISLAIKGSIPALFTWGLCLQLLAVLLDHVRRDCPRLPVFFFGVGIATCVLFWVGALVLTSLLWAYGLLSLLYRGWRPLLLRGALVAALVLLLGNSEFLRVYRLTTLAYLKELVLDYRVTWDHIPPTLMGAADFETLLSIEGSEAEVRFYWVVASLGAVGSLLCAALALFRMDRRGAVALLLLAAPFVYSVPRYMSLTMHYHVLRVVEFAAVIVLALAGMGLATSLRPWSPWSRRYVVYPALCGLAMFCASALTFKSYILSTFTTPGLHLRSSMIDSEAMDLARRLAEHGDRTASPERPIVYSMSHGSIRVANNELLFRHVRYLEGYDYDYLLFYNLDLLNTEYARNAVLVYPEGYGPDILHVADELRPQPILPIPGYRVYEPGTGSGVALVGPGWIPADSARDPVYRYLRDFYEGGIFIWSQAPRTVLLRLRARSSARPDVPVQLAIHHGDRDEAIEWPPALRVGAGESKREFLLRLRDSLTLPRLVDEIDLVYEFIQAVKTDRAFLDEIVRHDDNPKSRTYLEVLAGNAGLLGALSITRAMIHEHLDGAPRNRALVVADQTLVRVTKNLEHYGDLIQELQRPEGFEAWFNDVLVHTPYLKNLVRLQFDNGETVPPEIADSLLAREIRFPIEATTSELLLACNLEPGLNVLRLIIRDMHGARSGQDPLTGRLYDQDHKLPWVVVSGIEVVPARSDGSFPGRLHRFEDPGAFYALTDALVRPAVMAHGEGFTAGQSVSASWKNLRPHNPQDWIGVFPVGGDDPSRVSFAFTGGGEEGQLALPVPQGTPVGRYELRLFRNGGWELACRSSPFTLNNE
ncbi:MAG: hypothetical protein HY722_09190 [Planctomycetes bacterium]|nr:hypothetical protein [Planctomycetota bacterium]